MIKDTDVVVECYVVVMRAEPTKLVPKYDINYKIRIKIQIFS